MNFCVKITFFMNYIASSKVVHLNLKRQKALTSKLVVQLFIMRVVRPYCVQHSCTLVQVQQDSTESLQNCYT